MKKTIQLFTILCFVLFWGQGNFEYQRTWGTFYGPTIGKSEAYNPNYGENYINVHLYENNIYINKGIENLYTYDNNFDENYYNQYKTEGIDFEINQLGAMLDFVLSTDGNLESAAYRENYNFPTNQEMLISFDEQGNRYYLSKTTDSNFAASPNVWFSTAPPINLENSEAYRLLTKRNANGEMLWRTFLPIYYPSNFDPNKQTSITFDENNNIYLMFKTELQNDITTSGTFQENFFISSDSSINTNTAVVKLNPQGQLIWGSYIPDKQYGFDSTISYYNNALYILFNNPLEGNNPIVFATEGTFQQTQADAGILKLNANTGQRIWGTYYGPTEANSSAAYLGEIKVNETGVYILGFTINPDATYYGGPRKVHQSTSNGGWESIIAKFTHDGNRVWGTYFGTTPNSGQIDGLYHMSLAGQKLFFVGHTESEENIATSGAFVEELPSGLKKDFFLEFNTDGELQWLSYIGKTYKPFILCNKIKAVNENTFYLWGTSSYVPHIPSDNATQSIVSQEYMDNPTTFVMRFDSTNLATSEVDLTEDLVLYDNPNDGRFSIKGKILAQGKYNVKLYDTAGRLVFEKNLTPKDTHSFDLKNQLPKGNYLLKLTKDQETIKTFKLLINED